MEKKKQNEREDLLNAYTLEGVRYREHGLHNVMAYLLTEKEWSSPEERAQGLATFAVLSGQLQAVHTHIIQQEQVIEDGMEVFIASLKPAVLAQEGQDCGDLLYAYSDDGDAYRYSGLRKLRAALKEREWDSLEACQSFMDDHEGLTVLLREVQGDDDASMEQAREEVRCLLGKERRRS